jgi:hypothetical protein
MLTDKFSHAAGFQKFQTEDYELSCQLTQNWREADPINHLINNLSKFEQQKSDRKEKRADLQWSIQLID